MAGPKPHPGLGSFPLENVALGLLVEGPQHGYKLYQQFLDEFHLIWKAGQANFYAALASLEAKELLTATAEPQEGHPPRKVYHITAAGRAAFLGWLHQPVLSMRAFRVEFIARLRFFSLLGLPGADALIAAQIAILEGFLREWDAPSTGGGLFPDLVIDFRRRQAQMLLDWLQAWREPVSSETHPVS